MLELRIPLILGLSISVYPSSSHRRFTASRPHDPKCTSLRTYEPMVIQVGPPTSDRTRDYFALIFCVPGAILASARGGGGGTSPSCCMNPMLSK